jgi:hypothetical protein
MTEEVKQKLSKLLKGVPRSMEVRKKISETFKLHGPSIGFKGHRHSEETKRIIKEKRKLQTMKPRTEEEKKKIKYTILYGPKSEQRKRNIAKSLTGRKLSKEHREKISYYSKLKKGPLASNWRGGKSYEEYTIDWNETLRKSIRERDNYTCQLCSKQQGDTAFHVHHIDYEKKNCNPLNLITLCINCHMKTGGNRDYWKKYFENLMIGLR